MIRSIKTGAVLLGLIAFAWGLRTAYLYRMWEMACVWHPAVPRPEILACLDPRARGISYHGAFADIVFLRIPSASLTPRAYGSTRIPFPDPAPNPPPETDPCESPMRNQPAALPILEWGECYRVPPWFDPRSAASGELWASQERKGGYMLLDRRASRLYVASYQSH